MSERILVDSWPWVGGMPPFLDDRVSGARMRIRYWRLEDKPRQLFADVHLTQAATGPPGHAHGGAIAAVLDEAMALNLFVAGYPSVAVALSTTFERMLPVPCDGQAHAWIESVEDRKILAAATLTSVDEAGKQHVHSRANATYLQLDEERARQLRETGYKNAT